jgi:hypothetical protein
MLSPKSKGLFVDVGAFSVLTATVSSLQPPLTVERVEEFSLSQGWGAFRDYVEGMTGSKGVRYVPSRCAVYPVSRFFRRHTIESAAKAKDPRYFSTLLTDQFRIDVEKNVATAINAMDGTGFSADRPITVQKELLLAGARRDDLDALQENLVDSFVYPESLELGTLATVGGVMHYMRHAELELPTLILEIAPENSNLFIVTRTQIDICRPIPYGLNVMFPLIQEELGLKDEDSAKKLFYSNTFDFTEMGPTLLRKLLKELQASTGFYEVQTGQTIGQLVITLLPENLKWIESVLSRSLGVSALKFDYRSWLAALGVKTGSEVQLGNLDARWMGLISLMGNYDPETDGAKA